MNEESTIKLRALRAETEAIPAPLVEVPAPPVITDERILIALRAAEDKKGVDPIVLDLQAVANFTDYFLVVSGTNARQVQAIADEIAEQLKTSGTRAARIEGHSSAEWILLDYGDFIVHVFEEKARRFYDLERLWRDAAKLVVPANGHALDDETA
ncbi:MAG: ribosome silencing factor [Pyrinomonadaceae bacterium]